MVAFKPLTLLLLRPVVRPLFLTAWLSEAPTVEDEIVPISRIAPLVLTMPEITWAAEQSTLLPGSELNLTSVATFWALAALQPTSIRPGWIILSPVVATIPLPPGTMSDS